MQTPPTMALHDSFRYWPLITMIAPRIIPWRWHRRLAAFLHKRWESCDVELRMIRVLFSRTGGCMLPSLLLGSRSA